MSGVEIALLAVSTAIAAAGTVMQASNQAKMSRYNARVAEQNAAAAQRQAEADAARRQRQVERNLAKRRTAFASGGVSIEGSPLDLLEDLAMEGQLDVLGVRRRGLSEARQFSVSAARSRFQAGSALQQGLLGAGQQITAGGASLAPRVKKRFNLP